MDIIEIPIRKDIRILALGAESAGIFAIYQNGRIYISRNYGDILESGNFQNFKKDVLKEANRSKPNVVVTDLHPLFYSTRLGEELARKYKIPHKQIQHHIAHIFSAVGDYFCHPGSRNKFGTSFISGSKSHRFRNKFGMTEKGDIIFNNFFGIAADGTGYGEDGNIWGGEVFKIKKEKIRTKNEKLKIRGCQKNRIERVGSLEEQIMIGGDLAVKEPARMLISILAKTINKDDVYLYVKNYYSRNEFELLYNQLKQGFNCQNTTSTGRILDAVSVLLGFTGNNRGFKHEAIKKLEENSTVPYDIDLAINPPKSHFAKGGQRELLQTTSLFEYLIDNINKDKKRLAATAQLYIAKGFYEMIKKLQTTDRELQTIFFAGGMANNKIMSQYLEGRGVYVSKKIPRGDEGIAIGQIMYNLYNGMK